MLTCPIATAEQLDLFWSPATTGVHLQGGVGGEAGQGIGECSGIRFCVNDSLPFLLCIEKATYTYPLRCSILAQELKAR